MTTTSNLNVTNLYELTAVTFYLCRDLEFEYLMQMFHQNICISCLPLLFKFGVHSVVTIWYCLRDWELHDHTQTCERSPVWLCLKINVSIICETLSANITYITFCLIYTFECVWTCVHTWIIHRFGQGITSIKLLKQDHVTAWGECHRAHTLCKQYQHTKCAENTHVRWQKKHKCTLLHTLVHSRTLSHTLAHFHTLSHTFTHSRTQHTRLVCLAAHPSWVGLWSHIKQITTWETTRACEFTRTAENEDPCAEQVVPRKEREEG